MLAGLAGLAGNAYAATWQVQPGGSIQAAINKAAPATRCAWPAASTPKTCASKNR
jgi:hypothetical protein